MQGKHGMKQPASRPGGGNDLVVLLPGAGLPSRRCAIYSAMDDQLASQLAAACSRSAVTPQTFFALRERFHGYKLIRWEP